jgi:hypothetical protein
MAGRGLKEKIMAGKRFEKIWRENKSKNGGPLIRRKMAGK